MTTSVPSILIVDDQPELRLLARLTLMDSGLRIREAASGEAALEACEADAPDIVLLDVMLPGIDGHAVCQTIKRQPHCAHCIVILMTAADQAEERSRGLQSGADHYVAKPFSPAAVLELIKRILADRGK